MSTTPIKYNSKAFTSDDNIMAVWLHLVIGEIDGMKELPEWLKEIREDWYVQSTVYLGYVNPGLYQVITTLEQRDIIVMLCEGAMQKLLKYGDFIEADELNRMKTCGEGYIFTQRLPTKWFVRHGDYFIRLLKNELRPEETDARIDMYN